MLFRRLENLHKAISGANESGGGSKIPVKEDS